MNNNLPPALMAKFDQMFMTMTQEAGGLNPFLDAMFSFLQRRTDFYYEAEPGDRMGFPPGYSEQIVSSLPFAGLRGVLMFISQHVALAIASLTKINVCTNH